MSLKNEFAFFSNLITSVWTRSICQMQATFSWSWVLKDFIQVQKEERKFVVVCPRPPLNVKLGGFTSESCSGRQRNVLKVWCTCRAVVLIIKSIVSWSCRRRRALYRAGAKGLNIYFRFSGFQYSLLLTHFRDGLTRYSYCTNVWQRNYTRRSFSLSQKSRRNHRSVCEQKPYPVRFSWQKLSFRVWA